MSRKSLARRRPSAALIVSFAALFVALGGVGYAATQLPPGSVGSAQLQNGSVGNWKLKFNSVGGRKIINGAVGATQVNSSQVQLRVATSCATGAIKAIGLSGSVSCASAPPNEFGTSTGQANLGIGQIASQSLPAGSSYLVMAFPHLVISGAAGQHVEVDCTLSVPSGTSAPTTTTITKSLAVDLAAASRPQAGTIPLVLPVSSSTAAQTATVTCVDTATPSSPGPVITVDSTLNALQTAANG